MSDPSTIRENLEQVVRDALDVHISDMQDQIIRRVLDHLFPLLAEKESTTEQLRAAIAAIHDSSAQSDILRAMLDGAAAFSGRAALFVVRTSAAVGWQARGFRDNDAIKILTIDMNQGLTARVLQERCAVSGPAAQFDPRFVAGFGAAADGQCLVLPLVIREKVAALIYADKGSQSGRSIDKAALQLLVRTAGLWVELLALRKTGAAVATQAAVAAVSAPMSATATPARAAVPPPVTEPPPIAVPVSAPTVTSAKPVADVVAVPENGDELHRKARRFAKLLVDELRLYNQAKVVEGKQHRDLYDRLKDDIDKSRATYDKRYGQTSVASADYFTQELVRGLADNNAALLGSSFPR